MYVCMYVCMVRAGGVGEKGRGEKGRGEKGKRGGGLCGYHACLVRWLVALFACSFDIYIYICVCVCVCVCVLVSIFSWSVGFEGEVNQWDGKVNGWNGMELGGIKGIKR